MVKISSFFGTFVSPEISSIGIDIDIDQLVSYGIHSVIVTGWVGVVRIMLE